MRAQNLVQAITFSRIPLAVIFVFCFQPNPVLLWISFSAMALAYASDLADGFLARRLAVASFEGQLWDSMADKALYIAGAIALNNHGILHPVIVWALVFRDVFTFVTRVIYYEKIDLIIPLKKLSYAHCVLIYATMLFGFFEMYELISYGEFIGILYINILAIFTFVCGIYPSIKFLLLKKQEATPSE